MKLFNSKRNSQEVTAAGASVKKRPDSVNFGSRDSREVAADTAQKQQKRDSTIILGSGP